MSSFDCRTPKGGLRLQGNPHSRRSKRTLGDRDSVDAPPATGHGPEAELTVCVCVYAGGAHASLCRCVLSPLQRSAPHEWPCFLLRSVASTCGSAQDSAVGVARSPARLGTLWGSVARCLAKEARGTARRERAVGCSSGRAACEAVAWPLERCCHAPSLALRGQRLHRQLRCEARVGR